MRLHRKYCQQNSWRAVSTVPAGRCGAQTHALRQRFLQLLTLPRVQLGELAQACTWLQTDRRRMGADASRTRRTPEGESGKRRCERKNCHKRKKTEECQSDKKQMSFAQNAAP